MRFRLTVGAAALLVLVVGRLDAQYVGMVFGNTNSDVLDFDGGRPTTSYSDRHAHTFGLTGRLPLTRGVALGAELLRVDRGWANVSQPTLSLSYLEMPVLLRFGAVSRDTWPILPTFALGGSVAFLTQCAVTNAHGAHGNACAQEASGPVTDPFVINRKDYGAIVGVGAEARVLNGTIIGLEGRYEFGLTDIRESASANSHNSTFFIVARIVPTLRR
jgi:hypothetical protein